MQGVYVKDTQLSWYNFTRGQDIVNASCVDGMFIIRGSDNVKKESHDCLRYKT